MKFPFVDGLNECRGVVDEVWIELSVEIVDVTLDTVFGGKIFCEDCPHYFIGIISAFIRCTEVSFPRAKYELDLSPVWGKIRIPIPCFDGCRKRRLNPDRPGLGRRLGGGGSWPATRWSSSTHHPISWCTSSYLPFFVANAFQYQFWKMSCVINKGISKFKHKLRLCFHCHHLFLLCSR